MLIQYSNLPKWALFYSIFVLVLLNKNNLSLDYSPMSLRFYATSRRK